MNGNNENLGIAIVITGTIISIIGTLYNNIALDHYLAMQLWMISNPLLFVWAIGKIRNWWDGGVSIGSLAVMYFVFAVTNWYGLMCHVT